MPTATNHRWPEALRAVESCPRHNTVTLTEAIGLTYLNMPRHEVETMFGSAPQLLVAQAVQVIKRGRTISDILAADLATFGALAEKMQRMARADVAAGRR